MRNSGLRQTDGRTDRQNTSAGVELCFAAKNMTFQAGRPKGDYTKLITDIANYNIG